LLAPFERGNNTDKIERLVPAESQIMETGGGFDLKYWE
jgi:hypothetical protein